MLALKAADTWPHAASLAASAPILFPRAVLLWGFLPGSCFLLLSQCCWWHFCWFSLPLLQHRPVSPQAGPSLFCSRFWAGNTFLLKMLSAQLLGHAKKREKIGNTSFERHKLPCLFVHLSCEHCRFPGTPGPVTAGNLGKLPNFFVHPSKQLHYRTKELCCLSTAGSSNNGKDWFVIPGITALLPGYLPLRLFADRIPGSKCEGSTGALPGRKGIDYQSLFLPGRISLLQFILFNGLAINSLQMALGGSEGNDTRDYKSITIIEPFIR